eukprot:scaffold518_cov388-Prasinococcus_capsulatus_cf.AAC.18
MRFPALCTSGNGCMGLRRIYLSASPELTFPLAWAIGTVITVAAVAAAATSTPQPVCGAGTLTRASRRGDDGDMPPPPLLGNVEAISEGHHRESLVRVAVTGSSLLPKPPKPAPSGRAIGRTRRGRSTPTTAPSTYIHTDPHVHVSPPTRARGAAGAGKFPTSSSAPKIPVSRILDPGRCYPAAGPAPAAAAWPRHAGARGGAKTHTDP